MITKYEKHPDYCLNDNQIMNSIYQQVMSKFRPKRFPWFVQKKLDEVVPRLQLEKIVVANLKKH